MKAFLGTICPPATKLYLKMVPFFWLHNGPKSLYTWHKDTKQFCLWDKILSPGQNSFVPGTRFCPWDKLPLQNTVCGQSSMSWPPFCRLVCRNQYYPSREGVEILPGPTFFFLVHAPTFCCWSYHITVESFWYLFLCARGLLFIPLFLLPKIGYRMVAQLPYTPTIRYHTPTSRYHTLWREEGQK
jgi:hypothetical protein